jgi:hypothetical protein
LMDESKEIEKESKKSESESIRNRIISKWWINFFLWC